MGATNCPETPRQRMIGMMYLVLTAMLALNVSKEILNAFVIVNTAMETTNRNFQTKIDGTYEMFRRAADTEPLKAGPFYEKAVSIRKASDELVKYVENIKDELFSVVDKIPIEEVRAQRLTLADMSAKDNYSKPSNLFINQRRAYEMADRFREYKAQLVKIINDENFTLLNPILTSGLQVDTTVKRDGANIDWARFSFEGTVAAAAYTLLNKSIGEIRNIEFEIINYLFNSITAADFKFNSVEAKVIPNSRVVFSGSPFEADIIVAAFDSRQNVTVYWGPGRDTATAEDINSLTAIEGIGSVQLNIPTNAVGDQRFAGFIRMRAPDGETVDHPFRGSYTVTRPAAAVAAEKMNVFYAGIPNPVTIAAPVAPEKLRISWGGASAKSTGAGKYDVDVPTSMAGKDITVTVSAEMEKGKTQNMGSTVFRVKSVPEPMVFVGANILGGKQPKDILLANPRITARMSPDFNYELRWSVVSYKVTFVRNGIEGTPITVNGGEFSAQVKNDIQRSPSGTIIEFGDIRIQSIAGTRNISKPLMVRIR